MDWNALGGEWRKVPESMGIARAPVPSISIPLAPSKAILMLDGSVPGRTRKS